MGIFKKLVPLTILLASSNGLAEDCNSVVGRVMARARLALSVCRGGEEVSKCISSATDFASKYYALSAIEFSRSFCRIKGAATSYVGRMSEKTESASCYNTVFKAMKDSKDLSNAEHLYVDRVIAQCGEGLLISPKTSDCFENHFKTETAPGSKATAGAK